MKGDRKLRLVPGDGKRPDPGPEDSAWLEDEAPVTDAERIEAERTREALERGDEPVSSSLRAAHHPPRLEDDEHDALLARALGDPLAKPTRAEEGSAAELRRALDRAGDAGSAGDLAELARALQAAWKPSALPPLHNEAMIAKALSGRARRRRVGEIATAVVGVLALAAGVAFLLRSTILPDKPQTSALPHPTATVVAQASLIRARSTMELFDAGEPFPRTGGESRRIDRIASARAADLRANRYATWGIR